MIWFADVIDLWMNGTSVLGELYITDLNLQLRMDSNNYTPQGLGGVTSSLHSIASWDSWWPQNQTAKEHWPWHKFAIEIKDLSPIGI